MLDLDAFAAAVDNRRPGWERQGLSVEYHRGPQTDKPAAWVVLSSARAGGQLTVWVSGETELEAFPNDGSTLVQASTPDVTSEGVADLLDALAGHVLGSA